MFYLNIKCLFLKNVMKVYLGKIVQINVCKKNNVIIQRVYVLVDVMMDIEILNVIKKSEYIKMV